MTEALLGCVIDPAEIVRRSAVRVLAERESTEALRSLARKVRALSQSLLEVTEAAESLTMRHYRRIDPADQPEVFATMGWLTTAVLSGRSA